MVDLNTKYRNLLSGENNLLICVTNVGQRIENRLNDKKKFERRIIELINTSLFNLGSRYVTLKCDLKFPN